MSWRDMGKKDIFLCVQECTLFAALLPANHFSILFTSALSNNLDNYVMENFL